MAERVEDLSIQYEENGHVITRELDKVILSKGTWATVLYRYQDWDRQKQEYGPEKFSIRRYQKRDGEYRQQSKFTISSKDQARKIVESFQRWIKD